MTQAVSSMGSLEQAQLQQYTNMIRDKFSEFDADKSGGIRSGAQPMPHGCGL